MLIQTQKTPNEYSELIERIEARDVHLSFSSLKAFRQSPRHFLRYKLRKFEPTKAMNEGSVIDILLTEPNKLSSKVLIINSSCALNSWDGIKAYCHELEIDVTESNMRNQAAIVKSILDKEDRIIISEDDLAVFQNVSDRVINNPASGWLFDRDNDFQVPVAFNDLGWDFKGMIDAEMTGVCRADGKKMADASFKSVVRTVKKMWYDGQAAIYSHENPMPYFVVAYDLQGNVSVTEITDASIRLAWEQVEKTVEKLEECIHYGYWFKSYDFWAWSESGIYKF